MEVSTQIYFEKAIYFSGEVIRGQVIVINGTGAVQQLRERISLSFDGFSKTNLNGMKVTNASAALVSVNRRNSVGEEVYLQSKIFLTPEDCDTVVIATGQNGFPFQFELPSYLPSSYFSQLGAVNYESTTGFSIGRFYPVKCSNKVKFRVINSQDLNLNSLAGLNSFFSFEKLIPFSSSIRRVQQKQFGLVNTTVQIPSQGYVPGERIPLSMQVFYPGEFDIKKVMVELTSEIVYTCPGGTFTEFAVLNSCEAQRPSWGKQGHLLAYLEVPQPTLPSTPHSCYLISIKYFVKINIQLPTALTRVTVGRFPVVIGTVPLRQIEQARQASQRGTGRPPQIQLELEGAVGGVGVTPSAPSREVLSEDDEDIPPSYLEAVCMSNGSSPVPSELLTEVEEES